MIKLKHDQLNGNVLHKLYLCGIKLINARIDLTTGFLEDAKNRIFEYPMPAVCLTIEAKDDIFTGMAS